MSEEKMKVRSEPEDPQVPYSHLEPIVDTLLADGNKIHGPAKFFRDTDGWRCDLKNPINFALIEKMFELPQTITLSREHGSILCHTTWIEIQGGRG